MLKKRRWLYAGERGPPSMPTFMRRYPRDGGDGGAPDDGDGAADGARPIGNGHHQNSMLQKTGPMHPALKTKARNSAKAAVSCRTPFWSLGIFLQLLQDKPCSPEKVAEYAS